VRFECVFSVRVCEMRVCSGSVFVVSVFVLVSPSTFFRALFISLQELITLCFFIAPKNPASPDSSPRLPVTASGLSGKDGTLKDQP